MSIDLRFFSKKSDIFYKRNNHAPDIAITKHTFD